jgi:hypothetical protein
MRCSNTIRTARSRTSAENFGDFDSFVMAPVSQELEPPANPGRFILLPPEPCTALKRRSFYVIFLVEENVRIERRCARGKSSQEEFSWQPKKSTRYYRKHWNEEVRRIVALVAEVRTGDKMIF